MRKILFRGKRCKTGEWVTGNLWHHCEKASAIYSDDLDRLTWVDPETVGQFTGLYDKNEQEIFEGDILNVGGDAYVCFWDECNFEFGVSNKKESFGIAYVASPNIEIIGNIYDNPDPEGGCTMRKILFRGYSGLYKKWYYGSYLYQDKSDLDRNSGDPVSIDPIHCIVRRDGVRYLVTPETVGQYTGHTDMKGKKIFEGDIVQRYKTESNPPRKYKDPYVVHIDSDFPCVVEEYYSAFEHFAEKVGYEVIGNIHDNPELLTKNSAIDSPSANP